MKLGATLSLRTRLTLWYTAALGGLLALLALAAVALLDRSLRANVDASLLSVARAVAESSRRHDTSRRLDEALASLLGPPLAQRFLRLLDPFGQPDPRLGGEQRASLPLSSDAMRRAVAGEATYETIAVPSIASPVRILTQPVIERGRLQNLVQVAMPLTGVEEARERFLVILLGLAPLALGGVALGGWLITRRALAPVERMTEAARRITAEDLTLRLRPPEREDELGRLAMVLNDMLARLESAFAAARHFSANAAHELRTPLTILKGEVEVALRVARSPEEYCRVLESCKEEIDRLAAMVEDLLFLARADAAAVDAPFQTIDLGEVVDDAAPALAALAERARIRLHTKTPAGVLVDGSAPLLFRVVFNLAENAIKYSKEGGLVQISVGAEDASAVLQVHDDGPGISAADQAQIFERFFRADPARARGGSGLGLPLARSIVELHRGRITVDSTPDRGTSFRIELPRTPS